MTENEFTDRLIALFNEFRKGNDLSYVSSTARNVVCEWKSTQESNFDIDEVRSDYVDDDGAVVIDVWTNGNKNRFSVARILPDKTVQWTNSHYMNCPKIIEEINKVIAS